MARIFLSMSVAQGEQSPGLVSPGTAALLRLQPLWLCHQAHATWRERWCSALHGSRDATYFVWTQGYLALCSSLCAASLFQDMVGLCPQEKGGVHALNIITF